MTLFMRRQSQEQPNNRGSGEVIISSNPPRMIRLSGCSFIEIEAKAVVD